VRAKIRLTLGGVWPTGKLAKGLLTKPLSDAERFGGPETRDAIGPVPVFVVSRRLPVAGHELADTAGDHDPIVVSKTKKPRWRLPPGLSYDLSTMLKVAPSIVEGRTKKRTSEPQARCASTYHCTRTPKRMTRGATMPLTTFAFDAF
jgi:hypothetical protein